MKREVNRPNFGLTSSTESPFSPTSIPPPLPSPLLLPSSYSPLPHPPLPPSPLHPLPLHLSSWPLLPRATSARPTTPPDPSKSPSQRRTLLLPLTTPPPRPRFRTSPPSSRMRSTFLEEVDPRLLLWSSRKPPTRRERKPMPMLLSKSVGSAFQIEQRPTSYTC